MNKTNPKTPLLVIALLAFTVMSYANTLPFTTYADTKNFESEKTLPVITCPVDVIVNADIGQCTATVTYATPSPGIGTIIVQTTGLPTGSAFPVGVTTNSFEERTLPGGTVVSSCTFTITVLESENPTISCAADINTTTDYGLCEAAVVVPGPTVNDNCGIASVINDYNGTANASDNYPVGTTAVTWTVTDNAGNTATCVQLITVVDDEDPKIDCALSVVVPNDQGQCSAVVTYAIPVGTDNCAGAVTTQTDTTGLTSGDAFPVGVTTLEYTVTDAVGRATSCTFTITVEDREAPVVPILPDLTAQCTIDAPVPTTIDNCDGLVYGITGDPTFYNKEGTYVINWKFEDSSGNEIINVQQNVIIDDTIAPIPDVPVLPDINVVDCELTVTPPTANNNCKAGMSATTTTVFPLIAPENGKETTIITWLFDDRNGNQTVQTQRVTLEKPPIDGGEILGYISDIYEPKDATNNIAITSCPDEASPISMELFGHEGTIVRWEKFEAGDTGWTEIPNTTTTYNTTFNFSTSKSTLFRALINYGNCFEYSELLNIHSVPPSVPPILEEDYFNICLNDDVSLVAYSGYTELIEPKDEEGGQFDLGQFPDKFNPTQWMIDGEVAAASWTAAGNNTKFNNWSGTNNHPVGTNYRIEYDSNHFKFGIAHGDYTSQDYIDAFPPGNPTTLESPILSLIGLKDPALTFDQAWNLHAGDFAKLEMSLDGGETYTIVLQDLTGSSPNSNYWTKGGVSPIPYQAPVPDNSTTTYFVFDIDNSYFDLSAYGAYNSVRFRWTFYGTTDESAWAIDNIGLPLGGSQSSEVEWTDGIGEPGIYIVRGDLTVEYNFVPHAPGFHQYGATTLINGCRAYDPEGTALADVFVNYAYAGEDITYTDVDCGVNSIELNAYDNRKSAIENAAKGAYTLPAGCTNCDDPGTMAEGLWTVVSTTSTCGNYGFVDDTDPDTTFFGEAGTYILRWTVANCSDDVQVTLTNCDVIDFDGENDFITFKDNYDFSDEFSIEVWIKPDPNSETGLANNPIQSIFSKRDKTNIGTGYDLRLVNNTLSFNWNNGGSISSPYPIDTNRWYHVAMTYKDGKYTMYIDGIEVVNTGGSLPVQNNASCSLGATIEPNGTYDVSSNHFSGWIDELRIWNKALDKEHIRMMMNQQIMDSGLDVIGEVLPILVHGPDTDFDGTDDDVLQWADLWGYYRMDQIFCGYLEPFSGKGVNGKLRNITTIEEQTAPMPYTSDRDNQFWDTVNSWTHFDVWDPPNSPGVDGSSIDWNIAQVSHNISSGDRDITLLALMLDTPNKTLVMAEPADTLDENNDGQGLHVTHYLVMEGNIDLVGESQLVQRRYHKGQVSPSILAEPSNGYLERDQQGTRSSFNYNYWSSPVSYQGAPNNAPFTIESMLLDGTDSTNPGPIDYSGQWDWSYADGPRTSPIKLSNYWFWKFNGTDDDYDSWQHIGATGTVLAGEGYTQKGTDGTATILDKQNYVFRGKPNNGDIALSVEVGNDRLVGNPYPCALDANEFILDNIRDNLGRSNVNKIDGTIYYWDHFGGQTHILREYIGGYATYNLIGAAKAISIDYRINATSGSSAINPERYIPVGQGFFVVFLDGGDVTFKNSQRVFKRERITEDFSGSYFFKTSKTAKKKVPAKPDARKRIRLQFDSPSGYQRELLVGVDSVATNGFDVGYDAQMIENNLEDLYWLSHDRKLVIQGVGHFNADQMLPLGMKVAESGMARIQVTAMENLDKNTKVFVLDTHTGKTYKIDNKPYEVTMEPGEYHERFVLVFKGSIKEKAVPMDTTDNVMVYMDNVAREIAVKRGFDTTVSKVELVNYLGQAVQTWQIDQPVREMRLPVVKPTGAYIIKVTTDQGIVSRKVIVE